MAVAAVSAGGWLWLLPVGAYLLGSVPFGFVVVKLLRGVDIRETGSRNIGATNAARVLGFKYFPFLVLLDLAKGFGPTLAARLLASPGPRHIPSLAVATGVAAVLGHVFPLYLRFKGGKAVATGGGVFLAISPWAVLVAGAAWGIVFALTRYVSLASMTAAVALPVAVGLLVSDPFGAGLPLFSFAAAAGIFIIFLHRANIRRLLAGTENRIGRRRGDG